MKLQSIGYLLSLAVILGLAGCAATPDGPPVEPNKVDRSIIPRKLPAVADQRNYHRMMESALEWRLKAAAVDGEWRDVGALIAEAERVAASGDYARAIELAEMARFQAEMGYRQMRAQEDVMNPPFLYY